MFFTKVPYFANFTFVDAFDAETGMARAGSRTFSVRLRHFEGDIHHLQLLDPAVWPEDLNLVPLNEPEPTEDAGSLLVDSKLGLTLTVDGVPVLNSIPEGCFGVSKAQTLFAFAYDPAMRIYGLGEKTFGTLEVSRRRSRFWNTDVLADFPGCQWSEPCDPYYVAIPYMIVRCGDTYVGLLNHNPYPTWVDTGSDPSFFGTEDQHRKLILGSEDGLPSLWILVGPSLRELTTKLQQLVGVTPRPPLWALGYHQCRWEYEGDAHLNHLNDQLNKHKIPNDGLWLDIDYMDGYRVFQPSKKALPTGVPAITAKMASFGRRVVPILDPGVKLDPEFSVYQSGLRAGIFCKNPEGREFVGFVWPGETVYPDFSKPEGRAWWSGYATEFRKSGFGGAWLDMNDPATGAVDPNAMLFRDGTLQHGAFRNQYALGMQMATHEGFLRAEPDERPFLLTRSGYTGTAQYAAVWTGDNLSNRWYLRGSIPTSVNLSLSGIPWNGPDVGGFIGDTNEALMVDWTKACFLFPFFRNHSTAGTRDQEPWRFSAAAREVLRHYIRLRYKLLPYLYQCFVEQEREGHPILRPLQYEFPGGEMPDDIFMVGPCILQIPGLEEGKSRTGSLPKASAWFDARSGQWTRGKQTISPSVQATALYFRDGSFIPCLPGVRENNQKDLREVEFHVFLKSGTAQTVYTFDDGLTFGYQRGEESLLQIQVTRTGDNVKISTEMLSDGYGDGAFSLVLYGEVGRVEVNGKRVRGRAGKVLWTGEHAIPCVHVPLGS